MRKKPSKKKKIENHAKAQIFALSIFFMSGLAFLVWQFLTYSATVSPVSRNFVPSIVSTNIAEAENEKFGVPITINIPSIEVNAVIERVGVKPDGSMDVPKEPMNAAWYELGPRPGETGSAVIDGHVDWWYGATGIFANLKNVQPGHIIIVTDDAGKATPFIVREVRTYDANADATDIFTSNDGESHLNLITCNGAWDTASNQYSQRLVVFADRDYRK